MKTSSRSYGVYLAAMAPYTLGVHFRRRYLSISLGGLGVLIALMLIVGTLHGDALTLFYVAYFWTMLWAAIGLLALLFALGSRAVRRLAARS